MALRRSPTSVRWPGPWELQRKRIAYSTIILKVLPLVELDSMKM